MNPAHDVDNPSGHVNQDKPLSLMIDDFKRCSQGYAKQEGYTKHTDGCCHKTVITRCDDCPYKTTDKCQHEWIRQDDSNPHSMSMCKKCTVLTRLPIDKK